MKTLTINNTDLHFEHKNWKNEILFWKDEMKSFQNRLDELVNKWTNKTVLKELDQFQNNFIIQKEKIGELLNEIDNHEHNIAQHYKANEDVIDVTHFKYHEIFRGKLDTQREMYNDLKKSFFRFLTKYM